MDLIVDNKRDQRVIAWLVEQVGESAVVAACRQLRGVRLAYPSNVATVLGFKPPAGLALAVPADVEQHLAAIHNTLGIR